jgi:predicted nucleotidyltransferase
MHPLIENNKAAIIALCRKHGVKELYAFGSVVRGDFGPESDIDFQVIYPKQKSAADQFNIYMALKSDLESLLQREVDLVEMETIRNKYLRFFINQEKKAVYAEA